MGKVWAAKFMACFSLLIPMRPPPIDSVAQGHHDGSCKGEPGVVLSKVLEMMHLDVLGFTLKRGCVRNRYS